MSATDRTANERVKRMNSRKRATGQVRLSVWVYECDRAILRAFAKHLRDKREAQD